MITNIRAWSWVFAPWSQWIWQPLTAGKCLCYGQLLWSDLPRSHQYMSFARRPTSCDSSFFRDAELHENRNHDGCGDQDVAPVAANKCSMPGVSKSGQHSKRVVYSHDEPSTRSKAADDAAAGTNSDEYGPEDVHPALTPFTVLIVRGLKPRTSKVPLISDIIYDTSHIFIGLTETWLYDHQDAELNINGFTLFRQDRQRKIKKIPNRSRCSGGVALYINNKDAIDSEINFIFSNHTDVIMSASASQITIKKAFKLRGTDLCEGNPPVIGGFPSQRASNAENFSIWWHHHVDSETVIMCAYPHGSTTYIWSEYLQLQHGYDFASPSSLVSRFDLNTLEHQKKKYKRTIFIL